MLVIHTQNSIELDTPPEIFRYGSPDHNEMVRLFVPYIETLMPDEVALDAVFSDPSSSYYDPMFNVTTALIVYGRARLMHKKRKLERQA